jgi:hypothetical protein
MEPASVYAKSPRHSARNRGYPKACPEPVEGSGFSDLGRTHSPYPPRRKPALSDVEGASWLHRRSLPKITLRRRTLEDRRRAGEAPGPICQRSARSVPRKSPPSPLYIFQNLAGN